MRPEDVPASVRPYVLRDERVVIAARRHWASVAGPVGLAVVALPVAAMLVAWLEPIVGPLAQGFWVLWLLAAARAAWRCLEWRADIFVATDKRVLLVYGLIIRKVAMMPMRKVTDMNYSRSVPGRVLGYGTFLMESAGQEQALRKVDWVADPDATYQKLCDTLFGNGGPGTKVPEEDQLPSDTVAGDGPASGDAAPPPPPPPSRWDSYSGAATQPLQTSVPGEQPPSYPPGP
ncbi:PH domain-containing protein [Paraoerskovia marina]|uniref:PH domain-containing protein n=1 Tax=Paraoerskovia marina TaxID=545619 RepID=UPI000694DFA7|nr:PH domain-containing protein [Paraoerskovia marina]